MKRFKIWLLLLVFPGMVFCQVVEKKPIRIADSLTKEELMNRDPVLLKTELDSLVKLYTPQQVPVIQPVELKNDFTYIYAGIAVIILLLITVLLGLYLQRRRPAKLIHLSEKRGMNKERSGNDMLNGKRKNGLQPIENKIEDLNAELLKLTKENEGLNRVIKEYNGIQHEYDSLKQGICNVYNVKCYPGYNNTCDDQHTMVNVLETENAMAHYAYERFVKPILAIADHNKNNPAKMRKEDADKMLDLLVSLSLLYIEYLYLRVNELTIGGKIADRIKGLSNGNAVDIQALRKLNTEAGSRALVLRMALDKMAIQHLSYPVFDETNLNVQ